MMRIRIRSVEIDHKLRDWISVRNELSVKSDEKNSSAVMKMTTSMFCFDKTVSYLYD